MQLGPEGPRQTRRGVKARGAGNPLKEGFTRPLAAGQQLRDPAHWGGDKVVAVRTQEGGEGCTPPLGQPIGGGGLSRKSLAPHPISVMSGPVCSSELPTCGMNLLSWLF